jgi:hypothetical protein
MNQNQMFETLNPVALSEAEAVSSTEAIESLLSDVVRGTPHSDMPTYESMPTPLRVQPPKRLRVSVLVALAVVLLLAAGLWASGTGQKHQSTSKTTNTTQNKNQALAQATGTWKLADDVLNGTWAQYTSGPPPGTLSCPTSSICYSMAGKYDSPAAGAPLLSESVYVSSDEGAAWTPHLMPQGFSSTSPIACGSASSCAAGGTLNGQPVLADSDDSGQTWTTSALPSGVGHLDTLSCPTSTYCAGLAADSEVLSVGTTNAMFISTDDGGQTFVDRPIVSGDSMDAMSCTSALDCTAIGWNNTLGSNDWTAGVSARTTDGGETWTSATLPEGLGVQGQSQISCSDADHCALTGTIAITPTNPPQCADFPMPGQEASAGPVNAPIGPQSPAVKEISDEESQADAQMAQKEAETNEGFSCHSSGQQDLVGAIASTTDGGLSWTPDHLTASAPDPVFNGLSCPSDVQCWATGEDAVPEQVGTSHNGGSSMLLGTTDGGSHWNAVTFSVPQGASDYLGVSYLSMGSISCPSTSSCVSLGTGAQSAPSTPTYSLNSQASS